MIKIFSFVLLISIVAIPITDAAILKGTVTNAKTKEPVPFATINSSQNSQTIMTNEDGSFIFYLNSGTTLINCTHIAYYSYKSEINIQQDTVEIQIILNPSVLELRSISVYERNYDAAQAIIIEAIRRKDKILAKLQSYSFEAYTKVIVHDISNPDTLKPMFITESELTAYWKYPKQYKEIITARKQSANVDANDNLVSIGEVLNFNNNRIEIGRSAIVSPTAKDALDYYNYYLLDTIFYDSLPVYLLELEPKSNTTPLFIGTIQINANSYEVMGIDLTVNEGLDSRILKSLTLTQEYNLFDNKYWMPTVIQYNGIIDIPIPIIPKLSFAYTAALQRYTFENIYHDSLFEYVLEVDENADDFDSTQWLANRFIPLTTAEEKAYIHIDSVKQNKPLYKKILPIIPAIPFLLTTQPNLFHFNKVEGSYLGFDKNFLLKKNKLNTYTKIGYAFDAKLWQYKQHISYKFSKKHNIKLHASYHDNIQTRKTLNSPSNSNATLISLFSKLDPYDYYREKGYAVGGSLSPSVQTYFSIYYTDYKQFSIGNNTNYAFGNKDSTYRENPAILNGTLRSIKPYFVYETKQLMKIKGKEVGFTTFPYTIIRLGAEFSHKSFLNSDFEFTTLFGQLYSSRQFFGLGISTIGIYATKKLSGNLPSQKYTVMDYGGNITDENMTFRTLYNKNFYSTELLSTYYNHNFGTKLFRKSHIPLIEKIPFSLSLHGGLFWSKLHDNDFNPSDELLSQTINNPYSEIGFGIGRLPLLLRVAFTWQLSSYETDKFHIGLGLGF